jgi:hypothetical protein
MLHRVADAAPCRADYVRQGRGVSTRTRTAHASGWSATSSGSLPEPAYSLAAVAGSRPDLSPGDVRQGFGGTFGIDAFLSAACDQRLDWLKVASHAGGITGDLMTKVCDSFTTSMQHC